MYNGTRTRAMLQPQVGKRHTEHTINARSHNEELCALPRLGVTVVVSSNAEDIAQVLSYFLLVHFVIESRHVVYTVAFRRNEHGNGWAALPDTEKT